MASVIDFMGLDKRLYAGTTSLDLDKVYSIDLSKSFVPAFEAFSRWMGGRCYPDDVLARANGLTLGHLLGDGDFVKVYMGWTYWAAFVKGFVEYIDGVDAGETTYFKYFVEIYARDDVPRGRVDQNLRGLVSDHAQLASRLKLRFDALDGVASEKIVHYPCSAYIEGYAGHPHHPTLKIENEDSYVSVKSFDGYHRLFSGFLYGLPSIPCRFKKVVTDRTK